MRSPGSRISGGCASASGSTPRRGQVPLSVVAADCRFAWLGHAATRIHAVRPFSPKIFLMIPNGGQAHGLRLFLAE